MLARYKEAAEAVLRFRQARADSKDHLLRRAAVGLVPCLASFAPERFALSYLQQCGDFLLAVLRYGTLHPAPCTLIPKPTPYYSSAGTLCWPCSGIALLV